MIILIFRILIAIGVVVLLFGIVRKFLTPSEFIRCSRCEGKGFWYGARGKETCDWCKGAGKLPRNNL